MNRQTTIKQPVVVEGKGLFSGLPCRMSFLPAPADSGLVFLRRSECDVAKVVEQDRRTVLAGTGATVETVEHVLSALAGLAIDNLTIELDADEAPSIDGSPLPFVEALQQAGIEKLDAERKVFVIDEPIVVNDDAASLAALNGPDDCLEIIYELDYPKTPAIGRRIFSFTLGRDDYAGEVAPARTFLLETEAAEARSQGLGLHLTEKDIVVIGAEGVIDNEFRFADEPARHKVADLIGDLALVGTPIAGRIVASRSGHALNHALARRLVEAIDVETRGEAGSGKAVMDIRKVMSLLPHRYPFLMIDRVIEMDGDRRAVAVKNVSINEPFFQGHYPGQPIMPGVLTVEAMAQLSGLLLSQHLDKTGKVAVLLSMDRVKMRRPVRPGDQLIIEAESINIRRRMGHCRCRAFVDNQLAAEAEIKFMLVDAEPV